MKLIINFLSKLGIDSVSRIIGFITLPIITRALGPEGYGLYSYLIVILSYFGFFMDFGYLNYGTNKLCEKIDSRIVIGKILSLQILTAIFSYIVLIIAGYFIFDTEKYLLLLIFSLTFIIQIFAIRYYYLANNQLYYNSISELAGQLIYVGCIFFIFIKYPSVQTLIILSVIQAAVTSVFLFVPYLKKNKVSINLSLSSNYKTLKEAYKLGLASKAEGVTSSFIILSIGFFLNEQSVGYYNGAFKIYLIFLTVLQSISYAFMPKLFRTAKVENKEKIKNISLIFYIYFITGLVLSLVTLIFGEGIVHIVLGNKFSESSGLLKSLSVTLLLMPVWMFLALVLLALNRYSYYLIISISSTVLSVLLSFFLIKYFGLTGAGFVLSAVSFCTIVLCLYLLKRTCSEDKINFHDIFSIKNAVSELQKYKLKKT